MERMLKVWVDSGLKRLLLNRMHPQSLQLLSSGLYQGLGHERKGEEDGMAQPNLFSRSYSEGPRYNRKGGNGKGPPTVRQRRIASEVCEVISTALQTGPCENPVLQRCGFQIQRVKMSSDLRTAHVLWTALPGMQQTAEKAAISRVKRLRSLVFERLNLPFSPTIKFEEDKASQEMLDLDNVFAKLKESEDEDQIKSESAWEKENNPTTPS